MTHTTSSRGEQGFTLIELLVVILIVGILAAIALPAFLGQRAKAQDGRSKSDARNLASQIEACWNTNQTYVGCSAQLDTASTGLPIGTGAGQVTINESVVTVTGYEITATSVSDSGGANHTFTIIHNIGGVFDRQCAPAGEGGCRADSTW